MAHLAGEIARDILVAAIEAKAIWQQDTQAATAQTLAEAYKTIYQGVIAALPERESR